MREYRNYSKARLYFALALGCALVGGLAEVPDASAEQKAIEEVAHLSAPVAPDWPFDVDISALRQLSTTPNKHEPPYSIPEENIPRAKRLFDVFSWKTFLALNWPSTPEGEPDKSKTLANSEIPRVWEHFVDEGLVYQADGAPPKQWADAVKETWGQPALWMAGMGLGKPNNPPEKEDPFRPPLLDESLQAFTGPMIDQSGKWVRYQVLLNSVEFDYLVTNKLYNLDGQTAYTNSKKIQFPSNQDTDSRGLMEIKLAWKQMESQDDPARFFVRHAKVVKLDGSSENANFGLVGMHIAVRTQSSPTWIWATFEHVDNTSVNDLERDSNGRSLHPSFFNPNNVTKPINQLAAKNSAPVNQFNPNSGKPDGPAVFASWDEQKTADPTQTTMVVPVPKATAALNDEVHHLLERIGSVFQYYELIGTQWPSDPEFPAFPNGVSAEADGRLLPSAPESILYKVPGKIVPVYLINTTMETFFQAGNQAAGPGAEDDRLAPGLVADPSIIFATESCVGCHFSAGACIGFKRDANGRYLVQSRNGKSYRVPIFGKKASHGLTGNADYSWLMQLRSQSGPYEGTDVTPVSDSLVINNHIHHPAR